MGCGSNVKPRGGLTAGSMPLKAATEFHIIKFVAALWDTLADYFPNFKNSCEYKINQIIDNII